MTIKNYRTLLLLSVSITVAGCQTTTTTPFKDASQYENIMTIQADIDSDGDGVPDDIDECPDTAVGEPVDNRGCHFNIGPDRHLKFEIRTFYDKYTNQLDSRYYAELDRAAEFIAKYQASVIIIEGSISHDENDNNGELQSVSNSRELPNSLARNRVDFIKNYLISKHHVNPTRIMSYDCGARAPIAPSDNELSRSMNRRVYSVVTNDASLISNPYQYNSNSNNCIAF